MKARVAVVTPLGTCVWEKTYYGVQLDEVISTADMQREFIIWYCRQKRVNRPSLLL